MIDQMRRAIRRAMNRAAPDAGAVFRATLAVVFFAAFALAALCCLPGWAWRHMRLSGSEPPEPIPDAAVETTPASLASQQIDGT